MRRPWKHHYLPTLLIDLEHSTTLKNTLFHIINHEYYLLPSPPGINHAPKQNWDTPTRAKARLLRKERHSYRQISKLTGLPRSTIQSIVKSKSSRRTRKGKDYKPKLLSTRQRWVSACWNNRRASFSQIKATLWLDASSTIIRRALRAAGYRRCIAWPRPFISQKQAAQRLTFAQNYRWWVTREWGAVIWSDEWQDECHDMRAKSCY